MALGVAAGILISAAIGGLSVWGWRTGHIKDLKALRQKAAQMEEWKTPELRGWQSQHDRWLNEFIELDKKGTKLTAEELKKYKELPKLMNGAKQKIAGMLSYELLIDNIELRRIIDSSEFKKVAGDVKKDPKLREKIGNISSNTRQNPAAIAKAVALDLSGVGRESGRPPTRKTNLRGGKPRGLQGRPVKPAHRIRG